VTRAPTRAALRAMLAATAVLLATCFAAPVAAQSVQGRLLEEATRAPIAGGWVVLRTPTGAIAAQDSSDADGAFLLVARAPGEYRLEASHPTYAAMTPVPVTIGEDERVSVDLRMARAVVPLEPLTVTGRRQDPLQAATFEGAMARRGEFPMVGPRRVMVREDPELLSSMYVSDVLKFMMPARRCLIVYYNGNVVRSQEWVSDWLQSSAYRLDAMEFYRNYHDAPAAMRILPGYIGNPSNCSLIALWPEQNPAPRPHGFKRGVVAGAIVGTAFLIGLLLIL
jgi:hypothetical protein